MENDIQLGTAVVQYDATPEKLPPPPVPFSGHDPIPRTRDDQGNRLARTSVYELPMSGEVPLDESELKHAIASIEEKWPATASWLRHYYEERIRPAHQRVRQVHAEEAAAFEDRVTRHEAHNREIERQMQIVRQEKTRELEPIHEQLRSFNEDLRQAHVSAGESLAKLCIPYDPGSPPDAALIEKPVISLEHSAAKHGVPFKESHLHSAGLPKWITWVMTIFVGLLVGTSLGMLTNLVRAKDMRDAAFGDHIWAAAGCALVGIGVAIASRYAVLIAFKTASESTALDHKRGVRFGWYSLAALAGLSIFFADMFVERQGIMKVYTNSALVDTTTSTPDLAFYLVACVVMLGYLIYSAYEGYVKGRAEVVHNQIQRGQSLDQLAADEEFRANPLHQEAIRNISQVRECKRRVETCEAQLEKVSAPILEREQALAAARKEIPTEWSVEQRQRLQDAHDNWSGAQKLFDQRIEPLIRAADQTSSNTEGYNPPPYQPERRSLGERVQRFFSRLFGKSRRKSSRVPSRMA